LKKQLKFREDGTFIIVQFTDLEFIDEYDVDPMSPMLDKATRLTMEKIIEVEQPDLIVITGDVIASARAKDPVRSFRNAVAIMEESRIPWAVVLGNHDSEGSVPRKKLHELQLAHEFCVAEPDPPNVTGVGNFALTVHDAQNNPVAALYFLDSGDYSRLGNVGGYDWIRRDQIDWYRARSNELRERNNGIPLPSLAFFHIPIPEYAEVWETSVCYGYRMEGLCSTPSINSGLFASMLETGDVIGTFVGHDHANDYCGMLHGIRLCYGRTTKYVSYVGGEHQDHFPTGARIIRLKVGERQFDTWIRQSDGTKANEPEHHPEALRRQ
jgi:hypothetical protein